MAYPGRLQGPDARMRFENFMKVDLEWCFVRIARVSQARSWPLGPSPGRELLGPHCRGDVTMTFSFSTSS